MTDQKWAETKAKELLQLYEQPCGCCVLIDKYWQQECDCHNSGDLANSEAWCVKKNNVTAVAQALLALKVENEKKSQLIEILQRESLGELDTIKKLVTQLEAANVEKAKLQASNLRIVRGDFDQICSYCGWESKPGGASWKELQAHIQVCPVHPVAELRVQLAAANAKLASWRTVTDYARGHGAENSEPGDLQAEIQSLRKDIANLDVVNRDLWKALTPEKTHELNIKWKQWTSIKCPVAKIE